MKKKQLEEFKALFIKQRLGLVEKLSETIEVDCGGDEADQVQGQQISILIEKINKSKLGQLKAINAALEKIENNTFGICDECGEDISIMRLQAKPDAITCIVCAEALEKEMKGYR